MILRNIDKDPVCVGYEVQVRLLGESRLEESVACPTSWRYVRCDNGPGCIAMDKWAYGSRRGASTRRRIVRTMFVRQWRLRRPR